MAKYLFEDIQSGLITHTCLFMLKGASLKFYRGDMFIVARFKGSNVNIAVRAHADP